VWARTKTSSSSRICAGELCLACTRRLFYTFLGVGHSKFSPDYGAGVNKKIFRRTPCTTSDNIADCAKQSHILRPVITGSVDGNDQLVPMYNWQGKLADFKSTPQMKKYHNFEFDSDNPGVVVCREHCDAEPVTFTLIHGSYCDSSIPAVLPSLGLSYQ